MTPRGVSPLARKRKARRPSRISRAAPAPRATWAYDYNVYGELEKQRNALTSAPSWTVQLAYDAAGRLSTRTETEGTTTFTYHTSGAGAIGKPSTISTTDHSEQYTYSTTLGQPTQIRRTIEGTAYDFDMTYDGQGRLDVLTYPSSSGSNPFKVDYDYDYFGHMNAAKDGNTGAVFYTLSEADALGREVNVSLGNNASGNVAVSEYFTFDRASGRLTDIETGPSLSSSIQNLSFTWDEVGNLTSRANHLIGKTENFGYDALDRLTSAQVVGQTAVNVDYSASGRITQKSDVGSYTYGSSAHPYAVTAAGGASYGYDANGRMTSRGGKTLTVVLV
jgi:YD repeat-containing protein